MKTIQISPKFDVAALIRLSMSASEISEESIIDQISLCFVKSTKPTASVYIAYVEVGRASTVVYYMRGGGKFFASVLVSFVSTPYY